MRVHWLCTSAVLLVASGARFDPLAEAMILLSAAMVLAAELANTATEAVVDLAAPALHPLAKKAKDAAAGAVLVLAIGAALVLGVLLRDHWPKLDAELVRATVAFGLPLLGAQALLLARARTPLRWFAGLSGTGALAAGWLGAGDRLYLALLTGLWVLTVKLTSGWD